MAAHAAQESKVSCLLSIQSYYTPLRGVAAAPALPVVAQTRSTGVNPAFGYPAGVELAAAAPLTTFFPKATEHGTQ
jgi:hypothetical protein